jgi:hypothetical protein
MTEAQSVKSILRMGGISPSARASERGARPGASISRPPCSVAQVHTRRPRDVFPTQLKNEKKQTDPAPTKLRNKSGECPSPLAFGFRARREGAAPAPIDGVAPRAAASRIGSRSTRWAMRAPLSEWIQLLLERLCSDARWRGICADREPPTRRAVLDDHDGHAERTLRRADCRSSCCGALQGRLCWESRARVDVLRARPAARRPATRS